MPVAVDKSESNIFYYVTGAFALAYLLTVSFTRSEFQIFNRDDSSNSKSVII
jgi:hypothetical protein